MAVVVLGVAKIVATRLAHIPATITVIAGATANALLDVTRLALAVVKGRVRGRAKASVLLDVTRPALVVA